MRGGGVGGEQRVPRDGVADGHGVEEPRAARASGRQASPPGASSTSRRSGPEGVEEAPRGRGGRRGGAPRGAVVPHDEVVGGGRDGPGPRPRRWPWRGGARRLGREEALSASHTRGDLAVVYVGSVRVVFSLNLTRSDLVKGSHSTLKFQTSKS